MKKIILPLLTLILSLVALFTASSAHALAIGYPPSIYQISPSVHVTICKYLPPTEIPVTLHTGEELEIWFVDSLNNATGSFFPGNLIVMPTFNPNDITNKNILEYNRCDKDVFSSSGPDGTTTRQYGTQITYVFDPRAVGPTSLKFTVNGYSQYNDGTGTIAHDGNGNPYSFPIQIDLTIVP